MKYLKMSVSRDLHVYKMDQDQPNMDQDLLKEQVKNKYLITSGN